MLAKNAVCTKQPGARRGSQLAAPCPVLPDPPQSPDDYDAWQLWAQDQVLVAYGVCAARHRETVQAWPH